MTQIYNVGLDSVLELDVPKEGWVWVVYWYESDYYEGNGEAYSLNDNGELYYANLNHCSCYGPEEAWPGTLTTKEEFLRDKDSIMDVEVKPEVFKKVKELLNV